jgi:hypothetical protein
MQRCESEYCGKSFLELSKKASIKAGKTLKMPKNTINKIIKKFQSKKMRNELKKQCVKGYCNPDCKNTMFQAGKGMPSAFYDGVSAKERGLLKAMTESIRKKIFGNKTNVLKNSFYSKIPAKNVTRAKKQGALSGCSLKILT